MNSHRKNKISLVAVVLAAAMTVAACGSSSTDTVSTDTESAPTTSPAVTGTVEVWTWNNEGDYVKVDEDAVARFEAANPGATIKITYIPYADYVTKLKAAIAAGSPPDVAQIPWAGEFRDIVESGKLLPLDDVLADGFPEFSDPAMNAVTIAGQKWALPLDLNTLQIAYNKDMFESFGLTPPTSAEELKTLAAKLDAEGKFGISVGDKDQWVGGDLWFAQLPYTDPSGQALAAADASEVPWTDPVLVAAGDVVADYVKSGVFAPGANSMSSFVEALDLFVGQQSGMFYPVGNFISGGIEEKVAGAFKWDLMPFPPLEAGGAAIATGGIARMFTIPVEAQNQTGAVAFLRALTDSKGEATLTKYNFIPAWSVETPADASPLYSSFLEAQSDAASRVIYTSPVYTALLNGMQGVLDGSQSGAQVSESMQNAMNQ
ncbi:ABC transporter substrate-binding protein [Gemmatimonas sp.]|uniref:ABC transporter substrate-binding protein n=1 Tax=Gemmatimonas sp. TaxID=1962908 RepID=UPI003565BE1F